MTWFAFVAVALVLLVALYGFVRLRRHDTDAIAPTPSAPPSRGAGPEPGEPDRP
jgi:hypothetical protein